MQLAKSKCTQISQLEDITATFSTRPIGLAGVLNDGNKTAEDDLSEEGDRNLWEIQRHKKEDIRMK